MALNFTIRNLSQTEDEKPFHVEQTEIKRVVSVGATYTPAVSEEGVISWTNDQELPNPDPVNIKGPAGPAPAVTVFPSIVIFPRAEPIAITTPLKRFISRLLPRPSMK